MYFVQIAFRNLTKRPLRSFFTFLAVATAIGAFLCFMGMARGIKEAWTRALVERGIHVVAVPKGVVDILSASVEESLVHEMASVKGVLCVTGELIVIVEVNGGQLILTVGWPAHSFLWESVRLKQGTLPSESCPNCLVVGRNISITFGLKVGDSLKLRNRQFKVSGICEQGDPLRDNSVIMTLKALQELSNRKGKVATINFRLTTPDDDQKVREVLRKLSSLFPGFIFSETRDVAENNKMIRVSRAMAWGTSTIALFIAVVVILNTLLMSILERTREIGILNAVGWSAGRIVSMVLMEGLLLAGAGGLGGALLGLLGTNWLGNCEQIRGIIYPSIDGVLVLETVMATVLLGLLGSIYPALRALLLEPADALRYE